MLATLDVLVGFTVVMLVFSMPVTLLTQTVTSLFNLRGLALRQGVVRLLLLLDSSLKSSADRLAQKMLTHPLVATQGPFGGQRLASVVLREELARLILHFGEKAPEGEKDSDKEPLLHTMLGKLGIDDPEKRLSDVRLRQLELERDHPEMANDARATAAMLEKASSDFLAKLNAWFDQTMDRVSQLFALYSRMVTLAVALAIALALQVDSISLINRLASDRAVRDTLVSSAIEHPERYSPFVDKATIDAASADLAAADERLANAKAKLAAGADVPATRAALEDAQKQRDATASRKNRLDMAAAVAAARADANAADAELAKLKAAGAPEADIAAQNATASTLRADADAKAANAAAFATVASQLREDPGLSSLVELDLIDLPNDGAVWRKNLLPRLPGILITAALLSLGGGFWYEILGNLLKFRPLLAKKDEGQRQLRQTQQ